MKHCLMYSFLFLTNLTFTVNAQNDQTIISSAFSNIKKSSDSVCTNTLSRNEYLNWVAEIQNNLKEAKKTFAIMRDSLSTSQYEAIKNHLQAIETYRVSIEGNIDRISGELDKKHFDNNNIKVQVAGMNHTAAKAEQEHQWLKNKLNNKINESK